MNTRNHSSLRSSHGGKRAGAGRPRGTGRYKEPTRAMRIPESLASSVQLFLATGEWPRALESSHPVTFFSHKVAAGLPFPADNHAESLDLYHHLIRHPLSTFCVQAQGDSMIGAGICSNDLLIVDRALSPQHDHIVIASVNAELTVKRLSMKSPDVIYLLPENPDYPSIAIHEALDFHIWGVVTHVIRTITGATSITPIP